MDQSHKSLFEIQSFHKLSHWYYRLIMHQIRSYSQQQQKYYKKEIKRKNFYAGTSLVLVIIFVTLQEAILFLFLPSVSSAKLTIS